VTIESMGLFCARACEKTEARLAEILIGKRFRETSISLVVFPVLNGDHPG